MTFLRSQRQQEKLNNGIFIDSHLAWDRDAIRKQFRENTFFGTRRRLAQGMDKGTYYPQPKAPLSNPWRSGSAASSSKS